jgi:hypothetical protein
MRRASHGNVGWMEFDLFNVVAVMQKRVGNVNGAFNLDTQYCGS